MMSFTILLSLLCVVSALLELVSTASPQVFRGSLKVPGDSPLEYCEQDHSSDILQLDYFNVVPNPPVAGQNGTAEAAGTLSKDIENGAYVKLHITFGPITILKTTVDLCEQIKSADKECPIQKGPADAKKDFKMPQEIPNGKWKVLADVYTKDDERITCLTAEVTYPPASGEL